MSLPAGIDREIGTDSAAYTYGYGFGGSWLDAYDTPVELLWPMSNQTFDKMRRDAKVRETLSAVFLPVRAARYSLDPNGAKDRIVAQLSEDLGLPIRGDDTGTPMVARLRDRFSWKEHLRLALLHLVFGHMPFEQLYRIVEVDGREMARIRKLAPRMPSSISKIVVAADGGLESIVQFRSTGSGEPEPIPVDRLVWYSNEREGGAWQGQSLLRAAYRPWRLKEEALRVWATSLRRNGIGQPVYQGAEGEGSLEAGRDLARRARAGEATGLAVPHGASLTFEGVRGSLPDHEAFVRMQDEQIAAVILAEFLKLGSSKSGSRALGETFVDFFTLSIQAVADEITDVATAHIVEDWVDLNYGPDEQAPRIVVDGVGTDHRLTPEQLSLLMTSGVLSADPALENYVRTELYHLPARDPNAPPAAPPKPAQVTASADRKGRHVHAAPAPRDPTPQEQAAGVDFDALAQAWQAELDALLPKWKTQRDSMLTDLLLQVEQVLEADDLTGLLSLDPQLGAGAVELEAAMASLAQTAALEAQAEAARQGVTVDLPELDGAALAARAQVIDQVLARALVDVVTRQSLLRWVEGVAPSEVTAAISAHVAGLTDQYLIDQLGGALTTAQNHARFAVMAAGPVKDIYASELLDTTTCEVCRVKDGTQYATLAAAELDYPTGGYKECFGGPRCRGTLVAIYDDEA